MMNKAAWPWIGSESKEMGNSFRGLVVEPNKYNLFDIDHGEKNEPSTSYLNAIVSPINHADDRQSVSVSISRDGEKLFSCNCGVATTLKQKMIGLQSYDKLKEDEGLVFEYSEPEDVTYHMGTVSFPIDIIFIGSDDTIKKISRNIEPGSLGTFGCSGVKMVLEVCGGTSDKNDIKTGDAVKLVSDSEVKKKASYKNDNDDVQSVGVIYLDGLLDKSEIFAAVLDPESSLIRVAFDGVGRGLLADYMGKPVGRFIKYADIEMIRQNEIVPVTRHAFSRFLTKDILENIIGNDFEKWVILSKYDPVIVKMSINNAIRSNYGIINHIKDAKCLSVNDDLSELNILDVFQDRYRYSDISLICDNSILKNAGYPVPAEIKNKAKSARYYFDRAIDLVEKSRENIEKNKKEYEKIQEDPEKIKASKFDLERSEERNKRLLKRILVQIRNGIVIMDQIKDASTTTEVIDSIAASSGTLNDIFEEVFSVSNNINSEDFISKLNEHTEKYLHICTDLTENLNRAKDYINSNILGLIIIAD